ncbi:NAD(P)-binding protein [Suillus clintonianus]|uniref:NAD(P)-binding protein n=1 Tax=Suillus clintonianus TaxID=1904413 RepID=UPI001B86F043|nr:NAD(P)-binding protein [Suillus clintonianus]KAG2142388.1 NAD(P)-binding protein [Suillus clintonianus]
MSNTRRIVMAQSTPRVWLITGCSSGFGRAMVEEVLHNGEIAVAILRKPSVLDDLVAKYPHTQLLVLPMDVTNEAQVKSAFVKAKDAFGHIDVVYNNAGQAFYQELEGTPMVDRAKVLMDVNFWGAVTVSFEAMRFFREVNPKGAGGILVQVSSAAATTGAPMIGFYSSTKAALDSFTEVLAQEASRLEYSGWTRTPIISSEMLEPSALYASELTAVTTKFRAGFDALINTDLLNSVEVVTKRIWSMTRMDDEDLHKGMQEGLVLHKMKTLKIVSGA